MKLIAMLMLVLTNTPNEPTEDEVPLLGSDVSVERAVRESDLVIVCKVTDPGVRSNSVSGHAIRYNNMRLKAGKVLMGESKRREFGVDYRWAKRLKLGWEHRPAKDEVFIFYLKTYPQQRPDVIKIMRPTDENFRSTIKAVKAKAVPEISKVFNISKSIAFRSIDKIHGNSSGAVVGQGPSRHSA